MERRLEDWIGLDHLNARSSIITRRLGYAIFLALIGMLRVFWNLSIRWRFRRLNLVLTAAAGQRIRCAQTL